VPGPLIDLMSDFLYLVIRTKREVLLLVVVLLPPLPLGAYLLEHPFTFIVTLFKSLLESLFKESLIPWAHSTLADPILGRHDRNLT
jgi:hypothetical protein